MLKTYSFRALLLGLLLSGSFQALAQTPGVGIGTTAPDASAALDIVSSSKGALLPRLTAAARLGIAAPAPGLLVYQTDAPTTGAGAGTRAGFWYNGSATTVPAWLRLTDGGAVSYDPATGLQVGPGPGPGTSNPVGTAGGTSGTNYLYPYRGNWDDSRSLFLYRASLLTAAGLRAGPLTGLELNVAVKGSSRPYQNFTIQLANTSDAVVPATFPAAGTMTTVHTSTYTTAVGWNAHTFNAGTFNWDGSSNLLVQVCYDNTGFSNNDQVNTVAAGYVAAYAVAADGVAGCSMTGGGATGVNPNTSLPVVRFTQGGSYTLPATNGQVGQVLTQQAGGVVAFKDPQWVQSGPSLIPFNPASNVGVGPVTPTQRLDVDGGILARAHSPISNQGAYLQWNRTNNEGETWLLNQRGLGGANAGIRFGSVTLANVVTEWARFLDNGNLGIGTSAPSQKLEVAGQIYSSTGGIRFPDNTVQTTAATGGAAVTASSGLTKTGNDIALGGTLSQATSIATAGFNLNLTGTGNLGIGTSSPNTRLSINPSAVEPKITLWDGGSTTAHYGFGISSGQFNYHVATSGDRHAFFAGGKNGDGTELLRIQGNGNVGIGTTAPAVRLHVAGTAGASNVRLESLAGTGTRMVTTDAAGNLSTAALPTDTQQLSLSGSTLSLTNGGSVTLPGGGGGTADNLGNHTATQALNLQGNALTGTGTSITGIGVGVTAAGGLNLGQNVPGNSMFVGYRAGFSNTPNVGASQGIINQFMGLDAGLNNTTGSQNLFVGYQSGAYTTTGGTNQFIGLQSGLNNGTGYNNTFSGAQSGYLNIGGYQNVFTGIQSGYSNTSGFSNSFYGPRAGYENTTGGLNTAIGSNSGPAVGSGAINNATAVGANVQLTQSNSVVLGNNANVGIGTSTPATKLDVNGNLRLAVRNLAGGPPPAATLFLSAADIAFSIYRTSSGPGNYVAGLRLPDASAGQVPGQQFTIINSATESTLTIDGNNTDNTAAVVLAAAGQPGVHGVLYVWSGSAWVRVQ